MSERNCTFDPTDLNESPESVADRTETVNEAGGRAFEPDSDRVALYKNVLNNLLEDTYYQDAIEQFSDVVGEFLGVTVDDEEFPLQLATYARHEGGYRDIAQVLLVLSANVGRNEIVPSIGDEQARAAWNRLVPNDEGRVGSDAVDGDVVAEYTPMVIDRADEFNTAVSLQKQLFGKPVPRPLRRGIEDALHKRYCIVELPDGETERFTYIEDDPDVVGGDIDGVRDVGRFAAVLDYLVDNGYLDRDEDLERVSEVTGIVDDDYVFDEYTFAKYAQRNRDVSLHDVLNIVRPTPRSDERDDTFERIALGELDNDVEPLRNERTWESERSSETTTYEFDTMLDAWALGSDVDSDDGIVHIEIDEFGDTVITASGDNEVVDTHWDDETETYTVEVDLTEADEWRHRLDDMGLMARVRNLRNMREAGLSGNEIFDYDDGVVFGEESERRVQEHQQFPFRYYQAFKACEDDSGIWSNHFSGTIEIEADILDDYAEQWLESAIDASVTNLPGTLSNTFTAIDLSGSMDRMISDDSDMARAEIACLFGAATARVGADAGAFGDSFRRFSMDETVRDEMGTLDLASKFYDATNRVGDSTNGHLALEWATENDVEYDQFVFFTDEQLWDSTGYRVSTSLKEVWDRYVEEVNPDAKLYVVDLAAYGDLTMPENYHNVHQISGWHSDVVEYIDSVDQIENVVADIAEIQPGDY